MCILLFAGCDFSAYVEIDDRENWLAFWGLDRLDDPSFVDPAPVDPSAGDKDPEKSETGDNTGNKDSDVSDEPDIKEVDPKTLAPSFYGEAPASYFDDALFVGDSRMVGLSAYGDIDKGYWFVDKGLSTFNIKSSPHNTKKIEGLIGEGLFEILEKNEFGKVYVGLGINECGYTLPSIDEAFGNLIKRIEESQPDAIIYICANIHLTNGKSSSDKTYTNTKLNAINDLMKKYADDKTKFYIDVNSVLDDSMGCLTSTYSWDGVHLYSKYYPIWSNFIRRNAVKTYEDRLKEYLENEGRS